MMSIARKSVAQGAVAVILGASGLAWSAVASAQATNLVCNGCVDSTDILDNSIQSIDIKDGTIGTADIAANAVDSSKIKDGSVGLQDLQRYPNAFIGTGNSSVYVNDLPVCPTVAALPGSSGGSARVSVNASVNGLPQVAVITVTGFVDAFGG